MNRKSRSDSKLDTMPESRVMELRDKLLANEGYKEILDWLAVECGVSTTLSAISTFYKRHCVPLQREMRALAAVKAEAIVADAGRTDWNAGTIELVKQVSFEMMSGQKVDAKTAEKFIKLMLKADEQEMDKRRLAMMEAKAKLADEAAGVAGDHKLSDEEKAAELKRIFRMG
jgi:hypothetical protein